RRAEATPSRGTRRSARKKGVVHLLMQRHARCSWPIMPIRRWVLTAGALGICAMAPSPGRGATTTEDEATGYAGDSPRGLACGPSMGGRLPGGAARVRVSENEGRFMESGVTAEVAGSMERQHYDIIRCPDDECDESDGPMPDSWMAGGRIRGGYRFTHFSIE